VKAGDLLLCEKAFSHAYVNEGTTGGDDGSSKITVLINPETNQGFAGAQADLIKLIVQKLHRNPSVARAFTTLYHGAYEGLSTPTVDTEPIVDTFLVERIISFNVFGCPVSSLISHSHSISNNVKEPKAHHSCGIWTQASYINHSCTSTASRAFIGDLMIVRASRNLEPGTEITFWYQSPDAIGAKDLREKLKHWGFVCDCAICLDARETKVDVITERRKLMENMKRAFGSFAPNTIQTDKIEHLLDALNRTYGRPADEVPRLLLWDPQLALARAYTTQNNLIKSLESVGRVLTSLGFIVVGVDSSPINFMVVKWGLAVDHLVETFLHARNAFAAIGARQDSKQAEEYARTTYKIIVGEDTSFNITYK